MTNSFDARESAAIEAEIQAAIDSLSEPVEDQIREILAQELWEKVEASTQPEEVVIDHIRENYEITRDFKFPEGSLEDEAMYLLHFQTTVATDFLEFVVEKGFDVPCEHFPRYTSDRFHSKIFTLKEMAQNALETLKSQRIENAKPGETNDRIEATVAQAMERFKGMDDDVIQTLETAYRNLLLDSYDPLAVIRRRLSRYEQPDGTISIPTEERLDRAIHLLVRRYGHAVAALEAITSQDLSCGDHAVVYAGGVESEGNRIFTPQEIAENTLEETSKLALERIHIEPVSKRQFEGEAL